MVAENWGAIARVARAFSAKGKGEDLDKKELDELIAGDQAPSPPDLIGHGARLIKVEEKSRCA